MPGKTSNKSPNVAKKVSGKRVAAIAATPRKAIVNSAVRKPKKEITVSNAARAAAPNSAAPKTDQRTGEPSDSNSASMIRFSATLHQPAATNKAASRLATASPGGHGESSTWTFLTLPKEASAKLPSRGMASVEGTLNGAPFQATLEPDGKGGHWLKVERKLREAAGAAAGDVVTLEIAPVAKEPEPKVPADLRKALAAAPSKAREVWSDITPAARRDFIHWITSGKRAETRLKRIETACDKLAKGQRRPCCFDRSGMFDKSLSCPVAAP